MTQNNEKRLLSCLNERLEQELIKMAEAKNEAPRIKVAVLKEELGTEPGV